MVAICTRVFGSSDLGINIEVNVDLSENLQRLSNQLAPLFIQIPESLSRVKTNNNTGS